MKRDKKGKARISPDKKRIQDFPGDAVVKNCLPKHWTWV